MTTPTNQRLAPIHNRMPVILEVANVHEWLVEGGGVFLRPADDGLLVAAPANPIMNRVGVDGPECLDVVRAASGRLALVAAAHDRSARQ